MSALTDLRDNTVSVLANITDAGYPSDPAGTNANAAYFIANVHNFLKALGQAMLPGATFQVSAEFTGLGSPFFTTIALALAAVTGTSSSNKQLVKIKPIASSYSDALVINGSQWIVFEGEGKYTTPISGAISISNGVTIFRGVNIQNDISVSGGVAIFEDCSQTTGVFTQTGGSVIISNCGTWGFISAVNNAMTMFLENIKFIKKGTGGDSSNSISLGAGLTTGDYAFSDLGLEGVLSNPSAVIIQESNVRENGKARPAY